MEQNVKIVIGKIIAQKNGELKETNTKVQLQKKRYFKKVGNSENVYIGDMELVIKSDLKESVLAGLQKLQ